MFRGTIRRFYNADTGNASAGGTSPSGQQPAPTPAPTPANGGTSQQEHSIPKSRFDEVNQRAEDAERKLAERETADRKAAEKRAKEQGDWEKLAGERETEIGALKPKAEQADRLTKLFNEQIDAQIANWPNELRAMDPGAANLEQRIAWAKNGQALAEKLSTTPKAPETEAGKGNRAPSNTPSATPPAAPQTNGQANAQQPAQTYRFQSPGDVSW